MKSVGAMPMMNPTRTRSTGVPDMAVSCLFAPREVGANAEV
jgi:hypothetical protein